MVQHMSNSKLKAGRTRPWLPVVTWRPAKLRWGRSRPPPHNPTTTGHKHDDENSRTAHRRVAQGAHGP
jgi:hypothetical protein